MRDDDEAAALGEALGALGIDDPAAVEVLVVQKGRRQVVRSGDVVVKAFAAAEDDAFRRELAGVTALAGTSLTPGLVGQGERWVATRFAAGTEVPMHLGVDEGAVHRALGPWLAALHSVAPHGLAPWSVIDRLRVRLADPPSACPLLLAADVRRLVEPLLDLVRGGAFVHGDWGMANVLVRPDDPARIVAIIDFEDAHRGDEAEDFAWQVLAGPTSTQLTAMAATYGRALGPHAVERLVVAGAEKCLDVLGWTLSGPDGPRFRERCVATLDQLVAGPWPAWPHP